MAAPDPDDTPQGVQAFDRLVHEPARLLVLSELFVVEAADFTFLARRTGLTAGNLSSHMAKLEEAGYVEVEKEFVGKRPQTLFRLTALGREALTAYGRSMRGVLGALPD